MTEPNPFRKPPPLLVSGWRRWFYKLLGLFFLGLAILGALLPVLPTTPFLILASYFFVRSSPALNERLLRSRLFGPMLRDWQEHHGVRPHVKVFVLILLPIVIASSIYFGNLSLPLAIMLIVLGLIGATVVLSLRTVRFQPGAAPAEPPAAATGTESPQGITAPTQEEIVAESVRSGLRSEEA
jgi:uncharacterized membrane protein YbaN (DUF454 family)